MVESKFAKEMREEQHACPRGSYLYTAIAAGYRGGKLADVVAMIRRNRRTLGRDVNEVLKDISGKDYG